MHKNVGQAIMKINLSTHAALGDSLLITKLIFITGVWVTVDISAFNGPSSNIIRAQHDLFSTMQITHHQYSQQSASSNKPTSCISIS